MAPSQGTYHIFLADPMAKLKPGYSHDRTRPTRTNIEAPDGQTIPICVDSGAGLSLIRREVLRSFPQTEVQTMQNDSVTIHGVSKGNLKAKEFINIPITFISQEGRVIKLTGEAHIVDDLPVPFIIGNNIRVPNRIDIVCESPAGTPALKIDGQFVTAYNTPFEPEPTKVKITAASTTTILPGTGCNLAVSYSNVPCHDAGYLVEPVSYQQDLAIGKYGRLASCLINGTETHLPYANFGQATINIRQGELLGHVETMYPVSAQESGVYLAMESIFQGFKFDLEDETDDPPAGNPFTIHPVDEKDMDLAEANVSNHWGEQYESKVRQVL